MGSEVMKTRKKKKTKIKEEDSIYICIYRYNITLPNKSFLQPEA